MYRIAAPSLEKTGDGMAMAWRAGRELVDMEMYQFHPTGLARRHRRMTGMVLEEGLRGAGGILTNAARRALHGSATTRCAWSAPRATSSRAPAYLEIMAGRGTPQGGVLHRRVAPGRGRGRSRCFQAWSPASWLSAMTCARGRSKSRPLPTSTWAASRSILAAAASTACWWPAKMRAARTAPIAWAATASPNQPSSAPAPATRPRRSCRRGASTCPIRSWSPRRSSERTRR